MSFGVEDHLIELERLRWREQQVEILKCLCEEKALHGIRLFLCHHAPQRRVGLLRFAVFHKILPKLLAHAQVMRVLGVVVEVISDSTISGRRG